MDHVHNYLAKAFTLFLLPWRDKSMTSVPCDQNLDNVHSIGPFDLAMPVSSLCLHQHIHRKGLELTTLFSTFRRQYVPYTSRLRAWLPVPSKPEFRRRVKYSKPSRIRLQIIWMADNKHGSMRDEKNIFTVECKH